MRFYERMLISKVLDATKAALLIAYLPEFSEHDHTLVQELAEKSDCAVLVVSRMESKHWMDVVWKLGDLRMGLLLTEDPDERTNRILSSLRHNYTPPPPSLKFQISDKNGVAVVEWFGESDWTGEELAQLSELPATSSKLRDCQEFILALLSKGPMRSSELEKKVLEKVGCSHATFKRARSQLRIKMRKKEFAGEWFCELPRIHFSRN